MLYLLVIVLLVVGAVVFFGNRAGLYGPDLIGPLLLAGGVLGTIFFLQADTATQTQFGSISNPAAETRVQTFVIVCLVVAALGAFLTMRSRKKN